ncbi:MAG: hypothetical protein AB1899_03650 [Pseudomonadota bacterium]
MINMTISMLSVFRRNIVSAFLGALLLALIYHIGFLLITSDMQPESLWSVWAHIAFVWVPVLMSGAFFHWVCNMLGYSRIRSVLQDIVAAVLAPVISMVLASLIVFGNLPTIK